LFELAKDKNILDAVQGSMKKILMAYQHKDFIKVFESPVLDPRIKRAIIIDVAGSDKNPVLPSFIDLVMKNDREQYLKSMALHFNQLYKKHKNIKEVHLTTVAKVNGDIKSKIERIMEDTFKAGIEFTEHPDGDIIGGFIARVDDMQFDASISTQLNKIKKEFIVKK
jgi:F-type H+-transporting ATPase subunit delta